MRQRLLYWGDPALPPHNVPPYIQNKLAQAIVSVLQVRFLPPPLHSNSISTTTFSPFPSSASRPVPTVFSSLSPALLMGCDQDSHPLPHTQLFSSWIAYFITTERHFGASSKLCLSACQKRFQSLGLDTSIPIPGVWQEHGRKGIT